LGGLDRHPDLALGRITRCIVEQDPEDLFRGRPIREGEHPCRAIVEPKGALHAELAPDPPHERAERERVTLQANRSCLEPAEDQDLFDEPPQPGGLGADRHRTDIGEDVSLGGLDQILGGERDRRQRSVQVMADAAQERPLNLIHPVEPSSAVCRLAVSLGIAQDRPDEERHDPEHGFITLAPALSVVHEANEAPPDGHLERGDRLDAAPRVARIVG